MSIQDHPAMRPNRRPEKWTDGTCANCRFKVRQVPSISKGRVTLAGTTVAAPRIKLVLKNRHHCAMRAEPCWPNSTCHNHYPKDGEVA